MTDRLWEDELAVAPDLPDGCADLPYFDGFYASDEQGRAWLVLRAWRDPNGDGWQATRGPDGRAGPLLPTSSGHWGPNASPPGWRRRPPPVS